jgi:lysozyme
MTLTLEDMIVDISVYQSGISWRGLRDAGVTAAFLKATEGVGFEDAAFRDHRAAAAAVGLPTGAYHFARPDTITSRHDAVAEAEWFLHVAVPQAGDLLPALDLETAGLPPAQLVAWALAWLQRVGSAIGERPLLYTYPSFFEDRLARSARLAERSLLWLADWGPNDGLPHPPRRLGAWRGAAVHQYTSRGALPGIAGRLDLNLLGSGVTLDMIRVGRREPEPARWGPPWRVVAGGRVVAEATGWLDPRFQRQLRASVTRHPFVTVRGTRRVPGDG